MSDGSNLQIVHFNAARINHQNRPFKCSSEHLNGFEIEKDFRGQKYVYFWWNDSASSYNLLYLLELLCNMSLLLELSSKPRHLHEYLIGLLHLWSCPHPSLFSVFFISLSISIHLSSSDVRWHLLSPSIRKFVWQTSSPLSFIINFPLLKP